MKYGALQVGLGFVFVGIVVLVNVIANLASERFPLSMDLTKQGVFSISSQTKDLLAGLQKEVTITILADEQAFETGNEYFKQAKTVIDLYQKQSDNIQISYVDLVKNPNFATSFIEQGAQANDIIVQSGEKTRVLSIFDLFNLQQTQNGVIPVSSKAENEITSAIIGVTSENNPKISVIASPSVLNSDYFENLLVKNNFEVETVDLLTQDISQETQVVILIAPERDFTQEMLTKLESFLNDTQNHSKNLFYFSDFRQPSTPVLDEFLAEWGIRIEPNPIFETDIKKVINQNMYFPMIEYTMPDYAIETLAKRLVSVAPYGRAITLLYETQGNTNTSVIASYSQTSGMIPTGADENWVPTQQDITGPIPAIVRSKRHDAQTQSNPATIFAISSSMILDANLLASSAVGNADYIMEILKITTDSIDNSLTILPKELGGTQLGISFGGVIAYGVIFAVLIPLIILIIGIFIWIRRRRR